MSAVFEVAAATPKPIRLLQHASESLVFQAPAVPALGAAVAMMALAVSCPMVEAYTLAAPTSFLGSSVAGGIDCWLFSSAVLPT